MSQSELTLAHHLAMMAVIQKRRRDGGMEEVYTSIPPSFILGLALISLSHREKRIKQEEMKQRVKGLTTDRERGEREMEERERGERERAREKERDAVRAQTTTV